MKENETLTFARIVRDSCAQGDHLRVDRLRLRAALGFSLIALGTFCRTLRPSIEATSLLVIANGVAHGARLADALAESMPRGPGGYQVVADQRFAEADSKSLRGRHALHIPGLAPRSIWRISTFSRIRAYLRLRMALGAVAPRHTESRLYDEYVFLAQSLRFLMAKDVVTSSTKLLVCDFDRHAYAYPWVWACARVGIPTVTAVHGTPSASTYLPVLADKVMAWGRVQWDWFTRQTPELETLLVGRPDIPVRSAVIQSEIKRIIICHSREDLSDGEALRLTRMAQACSQEGIECVLRLHPSAGHPVGTGWSRVGSYCRVENAGTRGLLASLEPGDLVVGIISSALVDALLAGYAVIVLADSERDLPPDLAAIAMLSRELKMESYQVPERLPEAFVQRLADLSARVVEAVGDDAKQRVKTELDSVLRAG